MAKPRIFKPHEEAFIKDNRLEMSMNDIAKKLGLNYSTIRNYMVRNNLQVPKELTKKFQVEKLKALPKKHYKDDYKPNNRWYYDAYASR